MERELSRDDCVGLMPEWKNLYLPIESLSGGITNKRKGQGLVVNMPYIGLLLSDYYEYRNWSEDGIPTGEKLKELGLGHYLL